MTREPVGIDRNIISTGFFSKGYTKDIFDM